jgi:two-component system cell cycle sensor histidine kinase/response regulator CckA
LAAECAGPNLEGDNRVTQSALTTHPLSRTALHFAPRGPYLLLAALGALAVALALPSGWPMLAGLLVAGTLVMLAGALRLIALRQQGADRSLTDQIAAFVDLDASPSFTTNGDGAITHQNRAALERFGTRGGQTLARALGEVFANPAAILYRMQSRAEAVGAAREDLVTRRGHVRLAVHRIGSGLGSGGFLWRLEDMAERAVGGRGAETISLPMLTVSKTGTVLFMNEALRRIVGERVRSLERIFIDLPLRSGTEHIVQGPEGQVRSLVVVVEGAGGRSEVYLLPSRQGDGSPIGAALGIDAGETDFDRLPVAMLRLSPDGRVRAANRAATGLLGPIGPDATMSTLVEGLGRPIGDWIDDALRGRAEGRTETLRARGQDSEAFLQVTLTRVEDAGATGLVAVLSDATQLKTLEAQFVQSQKMQAIGQLAGGVAHDFNNLLTAISGHCDLLLLRHDRDDPDYADLVQINQNANRAASLVGQLLAFSRKQTMTPKVIDLRETLSDITHLLNRLVGEKVDLSVTHDPLLHPIRADRRQLEQVVMNLVVNARDAMPQGGPIRIETGNVALSEDLVRDRATVPPGEYVVVRVTDSGCGIAPDKLQKIFEPFYTTKRTGEGTGLGLSTAYGIVKQTGGFIFCDSVPGQGTTFSLFFPAHLGPVPDETPAEAAPLPRRVFRPGEAVVLLVEDEAPVRAFASRALRLRGYTVIEAENAEEALTALADRGLSVDVFVTDVIMPGMDGPTWVREALKDRPNTRVVFVSGYAEDSFGEERAQIPNSVFLPKPFSLSELTATVQKQLH